MLTADLQLSPEQPDHRVLVVLAPAAAAGSSAVFLLDFAAFVFAPLTADLLKAR